MKHRAWMRLYESLGVLLAAMLIAVVLAGCSASVKNSAPSVDGKVVIEHSKTDPSTGSIEKTKTTLDANAKGSGSSATGDKVEQELESQPASLTFPMPGGGVFEITGGGTRNFTIAKGNSSIWIMLACLLAGAICLALGIKQLIPPSTNVRGGIGFAVAGAALITVAFFPSVLLWALGGIVVLGIGFYYIAETRAAKGTEASRAAFAAIADMPEVHKSLAVENFKRHADESDRREFLKVKANDNLALPPI